MELANYQDAFNETVDDLQDKKDDFHETLDKLNQALSTRFKELSVILANKGRLTEMYASHNEQLQIASNHLYSIYYDSNRASRQTQPPKRFDKALPKITNIKLSNEVTNRREVDKLDKEIKSIQEYLRKQQLHITKIFETGIAKYKNLDTVSEGVRDE
jgi:chromosome segregation ATPase